MWWFMKNNITRQDRYSEVLNRLGNSNSMLGMGAQWEDDSDKCGCEWPGPGSLVSPSLVPCDGSNQLCGAAWCSVTCHTVDTPPQPVPVTSQTPTLHT